MRASVRRLDRKMAGEFISYRRDDSAGWAGRLATDLEGRFGAVTVFQDIEAIAAGEDFFQTIDQALGSCSAAMKLPVDARFQRSPVWPCILTTVTESQGSFSRIFRGPSGPSPEGRAPFQRLYRRANMRRTHESCDFASAGWPTVRHHRVYFSRLAAGCDAWSSVRGASGDCPWQGCIYPWRSLEGRRSDFTLSSKSA